jgi:hypothetical protein
LTTLIVTSPPPTNTSTNTNVVVGVVVGGNFGQLAVIVLGILYYQGKVSFNFFGIFQKMGFSSLCQTKGELNFFQI